MPANVYLTVDTEHSIGGAFRDPSLKPVGNDRRIYGRVNGKEYGIPLLMDLAERHGIPLTFFVEVLNHHYFGTGESREVCEYILRRGHDVQLHLHPGYLNFTLENPAAKEYSDRMSAYDLAAQTDLVGQGKKLLTQYCGHPPVAFRAGNFAADRNTLRALKANGLSIDSSYNRAFPELSRHICGEDLNDAVRVEGLWELPVTAFQEKIPLAGSRFKPLDLNGVSSGEMKAVLAHAGQGRGPRHVTIILHSFSLIKAHDRQYARCTVSRTVLRRFESLCRFIGEHRDCLVPQTLGQAGGSLENQPGESPAVFPAVPWHLSVRRYVQQAFS